MLTTTGRHYQAAIRLGSSVGLILSITDGTTTWYFGDREMEISEGHVHGILRKITSINESLDIYTRRWAVGDVSVVLENSKFMKNSSGDWIAVEEILENVRWHTASIYLFAGDYPTSLSHCLKRFTGLIVKPPEVSTASLSITIGDGGRLLNRKILDTLVSDEASLCPRQSVNRKIPIVYGKFTLVGDDDATFTMLGTGLARGEFLSETKSVFSNHVLHAITRMCLDVGIPDPAIIQNVTLDADDSGLGTGDQVYPHQQSYAYIMCTQYERSDVSVYRTSAWGKPLNPENALDRDDSTYATLQDDFADVISSYQKEQCIFPVTEDDFITSIQASRDEAAPAPELCVQYLATLTMTADSFVVNLWSGNGIEDHTGVAPVAAADPPDGTWLTTDDFPYSPSNKELPYAAGFTIENDDGTGDGVRDNEEMAKLYGIRLRLQFRPQLGTTRFAECEGREYSSWISSRSSNYSSGDVIEDPAGIIESILRDEIGLTSSDLVLTSFIGAENTSVKARLNLTSDNDLDLNEAIRRLCEQSTFAFFWSAVGNAKLITLNDKTPTTNRTILWSHIKNGEILYHKSPTVINKINLQSRWHGEAGVFRDNTNISDSSSYTAVGSLWLEYEAKWENICGTSATHVAQFLVNSTDGIWSKEHLVVEIETIGIANADLEIGDWIELDDESVDPHRSLFGSSWSGHQFMVVALRQGSESTRIVAIELF